MTYTPTVVTHPESHNYDHPIVKAPTSNDLVNHDLINAAHRYARAFTAAKDAFEAVQSSEIALAHSDIEAVEAFNAERSAKATGTSTSTPWNRKRPWRSRPAQGTMGKHPQPSGTPGDPCRSNSRPSTANDARRPPCTTSTATSALPASRWSRSVTPGRRPRRPPRHRPSAPRRHRHRPWA